MRSLAIPIKSRLSRQQLGRFFLNDISVSIIIFIYYVFGHLWTGRSHADWLAQSFLYLNHVFLVVLINYFLIPKFFHRQKYVWFLLLFVFSLILFGALEEGFWEQIFYPTGRGDDPLDWDSMQHVLGEIFPFVIIMFGFKIAWDYHYRQRRIEQLNSERLGSELKFLKSQINPHVLFNNLNNIYSYSLESSPKAPEMVLHLSDIMRYMLYECDEDFVPLKKEIDYLTNYVRLQEIQMEGRGEVKFKIIGDPEGYRIAPLLLIAFVENCFKHSMQTKIKDIQISITIRIIEGVFDFFAENNFADAIAPDQREGGIGLQNVKKRLELIYGDQAELRHDSNNDFFWVSLRIQLI